jgi:6-phosphogluconate dehydrogenase
MHVGLFGLGKMGRILAQKWLHAGHAVVGYDADPKAREARAREGVTVVPTPAAALEKLPKPRIVWIMVPAEHVEEALAAVRPSLASGDVVIDGANSRYQYAERRAQMLAHAGVSFLDVGVSGGPYGGTVGFSLMAGGELETFRSVEPLLAALAEPTGAYGHLGPPGAGHFVKMIHNGIEYGMMEAIAEGVDVLKHGAYPQLNLVAVARVWKQGSVIRSYLVDLLAEILQAENLDAVKGNAGATGEGEWTVEAARERGIAVPAIESAVARRFESQQRELFAAKIVALLRERFGGHTAERRD